MRHQIPAFLALSLVMSIALLTGQLVMDQSQMIQGQYAEADMYNMQAQVKQAQVQK